MADLRTLLAMRENQVCADCTAKNPGFCSYNMGVFICEPCAGYHRALGHNISSTCSVKEQLREDQLQALAAIGNLNAECFWECNVPFGEEKPDCTDPPVFIQQWIRRKYERKEFVRGPGNVRPLDPGVKEYETEGFLLKESGGTGTGKWQQRYFVLRDYKLEYYDTKPIVGQKMVPKNIVPITPKTSIKVRFLLKPRSIFNFTVWY